MNIKRRRFTIAHYRSEQVHNQSPGFGEYYTMVETPGYHTPNYDQITGKSSSGDDFITAPFLADLEGLNKHGMVRNLAIVAIKRGVEISDGDLVTTIDAPILVAKNQMDTGFYSPVSGKDLMTFTEAYFALKEREKSQIGEQARKIPC